MTSWFPAVGLSAAHVLPVAELSAHKMPGALDGENQVNNRVSMLASNFTL